MTRGREVRARGPRPEARIAWTGDAARRDCPECVGRERWWPLPPAAYGAARLRRSSVERTCGDADRWACVRGWRRERDGVDNGAKPCRSWSCRWSVSFSDLCAGRSQGAATLSAGHRAVPTARSERASLSTRRGAELWARAVGVTHRRFARHVARRRVAERFLPACDRRPELASRLPVRRRAHLVAR